jgi:hypothetical protein
MRDIGIQYEISVGELEGQRRCREDINKVNFNGIRWKAVDRILVAQVRG